MGGVPFMSYYSINPHKHYASFRSVKNTSSSIGNYKDFLLPKVGAGFNLPLLNRPFDFYLIYVPSRLKYVTRVSRFFNVYTNRSLGA